MSSKQSVRGNQSFATGKTASSPFPSLPSKGGSSENPQAQPSKAGEAVSTQTMIIHLDTNAAGGVGEGPRNLQAVRIEVKENPLRHQRRRSEALLCDRSYNNQNYERLCFMLCLRKLSRGERE